MDKPGVSPIEVLITIPFSDDILNPLRELTSRLRINMIPARRPEDVPPDVWSRVEVLYTDRVLPSTTQAPNLRWVQFHFAGIDFAAGSLLLQKPGLVFTNLGGGAASQVGEYVISMLLTLGRRLPEILACQARAEWPRDRWNRFLPLELRDSTVGIIGYGSIGREVARLLRGFDASVLSVKRDVMHPGDTGYIHPGLGDPGGDLFTRLYPPQALRSVLKECDFVVVCLPLTTETRGLIGPEELAAMKPTAFLVDVGRGGVVDQAALISALQDRKIAGAALDVFAEEPLPPTSPLWKMPNVIITPHIAGISARYDFRAMDLFIDNLQRYLTGENLLNRFDLEKGY